MRRFSMEREQGAILDAALADANAKAEAEANEAKRASTPPAQRPGTSHGRSHRPGRQLKQVDKSARPSSARPRNSRESSQVRSRDLFECSKVVSRVRVPRVQSLSGSLVIPCIPSCASNSCSLDSVPSNGSQHPAAGTPSPADSVGLQVSSPALSHSTLDCLLFILFDSLSCATPPFFYVQSQSHRSLRHRQPSQSRRTSADILPPLHIAARIGCLIVRLWTRAGPLSSVVRHGRTSHKQCRARR